MNDSYDLGSKSLPPFLSSSVYVFIMSSPPELALFFLLEVVPLTTAAVVVSFLLYIFFHLNLSDAQESLLLHNVLDIISLIVPRSRFASASDYSLSVSYGHF